MQSFVSMNRRSLRLRFRIVLLALAASSTLASSSSRRTATVSSPPVNILDLSYNSHLPEKVLIETVRKFIDNQVITNPNCIIQLDLSGSSLRDDALPKVLPSSGTGLAESCSIQLLARRNQLTPYGVKNLLERIITKSGDDSEGEKQSKEASASRDQMPGASVCRLELLDLSWNNLGQDARGSRDFCQLLEKLVQATDCCPRSIWLDRSGVGASVCRSIAKGLMHRYDDGTEDEGEQTDTTRSNGNLQELHRHEPLSLSLSGNPNVGDAGVAALAAAIRAISCRRHGSDDIKPIFDQLDLSGCGIGDIGADALAMAMENTQGSCIGELDLGANGISDTGASVLARAISQSYSQSCIHRLVFNANSLVGDSGAVALGETIAANKLKNLDMRSCHVQAEGAAAFGKAICLAQERIDIDLSGNPIGVLRGKSKTDGGKYSASRLKSKASATAASYMSQGMGFLKRGLKEVGMDSVLGVASGESDDEEEAAMDAVPGDLVSPAKAGCGVKAMANAFLDEINNRPDSSGALHVRLALRHCYLDHGAADALAAMMVAARDHEISLELDLRLNSILEDDMLAALAGQQAYAEQLAEMAERHMDAKEALRCATERAKAAGMAVESRTDQLDATWNLLDGLEEPASAKHEWDSDADYDDEDYA